MAVTSHDLMMLLPFLVVIGTAGLVVAADLFIGRLERAALPYLSAAGLAAAGFSLANLWGRNAEAFGGTIRVDDLSIVFGMIALGGTAISVFMSASYVTAKSVDFGEYYGLMLTAAAGMLLLCQANDLMSIFLGIEILSIAVYCLTGITRDRDKSVEASMKYFILGAFSTGFLLYGIALLYGASVSTAAASAAGPGGSSASPLRLDTLAHIPVTNPLFLAGAALFLIGFAFKIGAVPFHAWTPDAYEGAPAPVTGFMAGGVKAAAFAALIRVAITAFPDSWTVSWTSLLSILAALTMIVGNLFAVAQSNFKRLLAYSSIGHTGYILVGLVVTGTSRDAAASVAVYIASYTAMTAGAFGLISLLSRGGDEIEDVDQFNGLASRRPLAAAVMTLFMASLAGIPPTAGFVGKFLVFREAILADHLGLALIGIATSMISAYYYLRIVVAMYMREATTSETFPASNEKWGAGIGLLAAAVATVAIGVCPGRLIQWCVEGVKSVPRVERGVSK